MNETHDVWAAGNAAGPDRQMRTQQAQLRSGSTIWTPKRIELLNWFRDLAQPLADAYEGAVTLLEEPQFPGRVHFIAHAVRDIVNHLHTALAPQNSKRVQYENMMDKIAKRWPDIHAIASTDTGAVSQDTVAIPYRCAVEIDSLVNEHRSMRQRPSKYKALFQALMRNEPYHAEYKERIVADFKNARDWFMRKAHFPNKAAPEFDERQLQAQFTRFEGILHSFVGDFFTGIAEIDEILQQANQ